MPADAAVASVPYPNDRPHIAWVPPGATGWEKLFVIQVPSGIRKITSDNYFNFLSDRLAWMIRKSGDTEDAMRSIADTFKELGLVREPPRTLALGIFTIDIIATNPVFLGHVTSALGTLPVVLKDFLPAALVMLSRVTIQEWMAELHKWGSTIKAAKPRGGMKKRTPK